MQSKSNPRVKNLAKRCFDFFFSSLGLLLLAPIVALFAILIKLDSSGPVFYRGSRMGRYGKPFKILKFRTMLENPESFSGPKITGNGDSRITKVGAWLRDTKINELPQLWNVFVGEMSLVGPRPEDVEIAKTWEPSVFEEILSIRPGITSPASITYSDEEKMLDPSNLLAKYFEIIQPDKQRLDLMYVRHRSMLLDVNVILATLLCLLPGFRSAKIPESKLFGGFLFKFLRRYVQWIFLDTTLSILMISFTGLVWRLITPINIGIPLALAFALALSLIYSLIINLVGINGVEWSRATNENSFDLLVATGSLTLIAFLLEISNLRHPYPDGFIIINVFVVSTGFYLLRIRKSILSGFYHKLNRYTRQQIALGERTLIIGAGEGGTIASWLLERREFNQKIIIIGFVDDDFRKLGTMINGHEVIGTTDELEELIVKYDVGLVIMAIGDISMAKKKKLLEISKKLGKSVIEMSELLGNMHEVINLNEARNVGGA